MKKAIIIILRALFLIVELYAQKTYPINEDGQYEDMLTPEYYLSEDGASFRNEVNTFIHFARLDSFHHPLEDSLGHIPPYNTNRDFGVGIGPTGTEQHHPAADWHLENVQDLVNLYAAYDGYVETFRDSPKYRHYLTITKNIEDSIGNIIGKIVTIYAHIDLDLDSIDQILVHGQFVNEGDLISKHLYSGTMGGPHLHFEIRYYRTADTGREEFYSFVGPGGSTTLTEPSAGIWSYGFWNPNIGYGFVNPINHLSGSSLSISENKFAQKLTLYPNPSTGLVSIDLNALYQSVSISIYDIKSQLIESKDDTFTSTIQFSLAHYKQGVYFIHVIDKESGNTAVLKLLKI